MSASLTRLLLIRHGEAEGNREFRYLGDTDAPLTPNGQAQALRLAEVLLSAPLSAIYVSPLARARATAAALVAGRSDALTPQVEPRLREQSYGAWEGLTALEAQTQHPQEHVEWQRATRNAPPGGESLASLRARSVECASVLASRHAGEVVALVSHVGPIKALVCAALGLPMRAARHMWLTPASVCIVDWPAVASEASDYDDETQALGVLRVFNGGADLAALAQPLR